MVINNSWVGKNVLITTQSFFTAPDGKEYKSVWGELKGIHEAKDYFGFIPNRAHANWFIEIGCMFIMGCQGLYFILCEKEPSTERRQAWTFDAANGIKEFDAPTLIYISK